jgi:hypothetical protein
MPDSSIGRVKHALSSRLSIWIGIAVGISTIIGSIAAVGMWIDGRYVDKYETALALNGVTDQINSNLKTINSNIIILGNVFYTNEITRVKDFIKQLEERNDLNQNEVIFLREMRVKLADLERQQKKLQDTKIKITNGEVE